ncbi:MAG: four-helix bundle copper-binding protein [Alphaproteobacteria bacterium]|nr:four-helix bundle copper-binding protein [Alphaproteobacteria bacterium]
MARGSQHHIHICRECAEICRACAESCRALDGARSIINAATWSLNVILMRLSLARATYTYRRSVNNPLT